MKKFYVTGLLCILFAFSGQGQGLYSNQNLEQSSQLNLKLYLYKADNIKMAGITLCITGPIAAAFGIKLAYDNIFTANSGEGIVLAYVGTAATLTGIILLVVGSRRVKRTKNMINNNSSRVSIELFPYNVQNYMSQENQNGVTLILRY